MSSHIPALLGPDFYGFILPFIFTFAIVYGLLLKAKIFEKNERISAMLALVIAFFVTAVGGTTLAAFFTNLFGGASMFLGGILVVILLVTLVSGGEITKAKNMAVILITVLIGAFLFLSSSSATGFIGIAVDSTTATLAFALIVILVAIYYVTRPEVKETPKQG